MSLRKALQDRSLVLSTVVVVLLAAVGVFALWPRSHEHSGGDVAHEESQVSAAQGAPEPVGVRLNALRQRAGLMPCPQRTAGASAAGPLVGVRVPCLGSPGQVDLGEAFAGKAVLINLWASWCQPCREEMPVLAAYSQQPGAIPVIGVNVQDKPENALELAGQLGLRYPSVIDSGGRVQRALSVPKVLPVSYVVRADGSVERITDPLVFKSPEEVREAVGRALNS